MPLSILTVVAVMALIGLAIAVVATVRAESHGGAGVAASFTYRAYGA